MKIAYYCQHVLGIGHFHRSLEICKALAHHHEVWLIIGGPDVEPVPEPIKAYQLPGLQMDADFKNLAPCDPATTLEQTKALRKEKLNSFFARQKPDIFIVELYPFGRKAFRFELDPVLSSIRQGTLPPCKCYVSLRDILVERPDDRAKFEERVIKILHSSFDGLLIHSDDEIITLDETFQRYNDITIPLAYTGFVTPLGPVGSREKLRRQLSLNDSDKLIVTSVGGGNVGSELLISTLDAFHAIESRSYHLQIFTGPYCSDETFQKLQDNLPDRTELTRFSNSFPDWLQAADLSISMAGYNTCMNIIQAGIPALVYPFAQNMEQIFRATRLQKKATIEILDKDGLAPEQLASTIVKMSARKRYPVNINLSGAANSLKQIEMWHNSP